MMPRNERLALPDGYKKGGKVKKGKKAKKSRKATGKRRRTGKKTRQEPMKYVPLGGALPTTGMSSTVFGAPQAPSYFRAVLPQQEYGNMPDVLKSLKAGQEKILKDIERRKQQEAADKVFATTVETETRQKTLTESGYATPVEDYSRRATPDFLKRFAFQPVVAGEWPSGVRPVPIRPVTSLTSNTLEPLKRQESQTPEIITPQASFMAPKRVISPSYMGPLSSQEAMRAEPYRGADPSLPAQPVASGEQMEAKDASIEASANSSYYALGAQAPESVEEAVDRSSSIAGDIGLPPIQHTPDNGKYIVRAGQRYSVRVVDGAPKYIKVPIPEVEQAPAPTPVKIKRPITKPEVEQAPAPKGELTKEEQLKRADAKFQAIVAARKAAKAAKAASSQGQ